MHEVVKRLKILIPHLNDTSIHQKNEIISSMPNENLLSNKIETSLHGELTQIMQKFHNMSTEEMECTASTNKQMIKIVMTFHPGVV